MRPICPLPPGITIRMAGMKLENYGKGSLGKGLRIRQKAPDARQPPKLA